MKADEFVPAIEHLKNAMVARCTSGYYDYAEDDYVEARKAIVNHPALAPLCPEWLRRGSSMEDARGRINAAAGDQPGKWERRRELIREGIEPMLDALDQPEGALPVTSPELGERLGSGGFGEVYRYRHKFVPHDFAVKVLNPSFDEGRNRAVARFFQEAQILFRLSHPNIVRVFDVGMVGPRPYIRMELIEGRTLDTEGALIPAHAQTIIGRLASALAHANAMNVVHRDLRPSNIMLENGTNRPVLLDFGLGAFVESEIASRITKIGTAAATGSYTAPELLERPDLLDPKTDVYSLGVIWYQAVTGQLPRLRKAEALLEQTGVDASTRSLLMACLGDSAERPSAGELVEELRRLSARSAR
jgi:serine/threonine-protein kinase